ncbi:MULTISPECIES: metallophosphoesterase [Aphanothece]|uniref:metallophosphoesterase n=1 Tax=Aphanothece TaxID=1121 RepID=UPI00398505D0
MRLLQLSDPHLLADPTGTYRARQPRQWLAHALRQALAGVPEAPDLLLISGDLCQDESLGGYGVLRELLQPLGVPVALLPGNHDHPLLLRAALGRCTRIAPALLRVGDGWLLLLDSHRPGATEGWLGRRQLAWLAERLQELRRRADRLPLVVAVHHPPVAIGDPVMDPIRLMDGEQLMALLQDAPGLEAVLFGHVHQHWQGALPGREAVPLLGCPSTLCGFTPVQPCPLGRPDDPGGRWVAISPSGGLRHSLLRWSAP